jgi:hypothetical protein
VNFQNEMQINFFSLLGSHFVLPEEEDDDEALGFSFHEGIIDIGLEVQRDVLHIRCSHSEEFQTPKVPEVLKLTASNERKRGSKGDVG